MYGWMGAEKSLRSLPETVSHLSVQGVTHLLLFLMRFLFSFGSTRPLAGLQVAYYRFLGGVLTITHLLSVSCPSILKHANLLPKHNGIT